MKNRRTRTFLPSSLGKVLQSIASAFVSKQGFVWAAILQDWPSVVGEIYKDMVMPKKIMFPKGKNTDGTLSVIVENSGAALLVQHLQPLILERVNRYFGYKAITKMAMRQGIFPEKSLLDQEAPKKGRPLTHEEQEEIQHLLKSFPEGPLRETLKSFAESLFKSDGL
jgi:hypothetical protein